jgi:ElaB/YqjD/DUF883 family membrane-anchored ribosome-binding protein
VTEHAAIVREYLERSGVGTMAQELAALAALDALVAERDEVVRLRLESIQLLTDRCEAAEAEVARLREALDTMLTAIRFALSDSPEAIVSDGVARWADADGVEHSGPFLASGGEAALGEDA